MGTGFLLGYALPQRTPQGQPYYGYLVTAKHVLQDAERLGAQSLVARSADRKTGRPIDFDVDVCGSEGKAHWLGHPKSEVDVAVLPVLVANIKAAGAQVSLLPSDIGCWTLTQMQRVGVLEGDGVFVLGFPLGLVDDVIPAPIVRAGVVARIRDTYADPVRAPLIETAAFPGSSGGPVFIRPEVTSIPDTRAVQESRCIGLITTVYTWDDVAVSQSTNQARVVFVENAGLAKMEPIDRALHIIEADIERRRSSGTLPAFPAVTPQVDRVN